ncbi:Hsp70 family protein [Lapillicoccus jejuensis]|uniref:Chaperone protein HscA n=1 Tax=Lapillicoccus jejuensis TaxID=402171 RepID=A0A542E0Y8_9MICO|nr:Hsp70 family protein [Lapillicoccus jejuensis]TQJ08985.1 chaperone protein HscA [Lapillicoccus jejuensis]
MDLGLDFGTTRTVVAQADRGNYPVLSFPDEHEDAHDHVPTVVADDGGGLVFGFDALAAARRGAPLLRSVKRSLADPGVTAESTVWVGERELPLLDVLTGFFAHLREAVDGALDRSSGDDAPRTVVGVPARAHSAQRFLTLEAVRRGGFDVVGMVNEPSAGSLEFAHRQSRSVTSRRDHVLVYDLGGGTFDASLLRLDGTRHEVVESYGVERLGGDDFDALLARLALERAGTTRAALGTAGWADLLDEARRAKEGLTPQTRRVGLEVADGDGGTRLVTVDVADFYDAATPLVERSADAMAPLVALLPAATDGEELPGVAGVYVVGGATSLPLVPRVLRARFGRRVHRSPLPSASTAIGLAIAADPDRPFSLRDRLSRGFGVFREREAGGQVSFDPILDRGLLTPDPVAPGDASERLTVTRRYRAAHSVGWFRFVEYAGLDAAGQPRGDLAPAGEVLFPFDPALQGEGVALRDAPVVRREHGPLVEERYTVDPAGVVSVEVVDLDTGYRTVQEVGAGVR